MVTVFAAPFTLGIEGPASRELACPALAVCFIAGTPAQTVRKAKDGKFHARVKAIETVRKDDLVFARNPKTGKTQVRRVLQTTVLPSACVVTVALADARTHRVVENITATRQHPFYVRGKGFVPAGGLAVGNAIVTRAGPALVVKSVTWHRRPEGYRVYNFIVEDDHTYFVGTHNGGAWVHNPPGWCGTFRTQAYDVGSYRDLELASDVGDGLSLHHLPQNALTSIPTARGPAIALPSAEHDLITAEQNANSAARAAMSRQQLTQDDLRMLREHSSAPSSAIEAIEKLARLAGY